MSVKIQMLELSTAHVSKATAEWLDQEGIIAASKPPSRQARLHMASHEWGWFVYVSEEHDESSLFPDDLMACLAKARDEDCEYIKFDCDGQKRSDLQVFEW